MSFWFSRHEREADGPRPAHEQGIRDNCSARQRPKRHSGPAPDDPIKNWETVDQSFLRQAGDPLSLIHI